MELPFKDIPERCTILGAFAAIKTLGEDGSVAWFVRYSEDLSNAEVIGEMEAMKYRLLKDLAGAFEADDD